MNRIVALIIILLPCWSVAGQTLTLDEVLTSAQQAFPNLLIAQQRQRASEGEHQAAEGGFDTLLKSRNSYSVIGIYENQNNDISIEQPTSLGGTTFFGGWRRGAGDYAVYDGKSLTAEEGEMRLGVNIPLWRNRDIDSRRAGLKKAELGLGIADHEFDQTLLEISRLATHRYWDWVLAGQRLQITERLLNIAEQRNDGIRQRVAAGDIPEFEALDNQRAIIERQERKVAAQRLLEQTAIQLSLYWRDADGQPKLPDSRQLPATFPPHESNNTLDYQKALEIARAQRPDLQRLDLQIEQNKTELELQENQLAPAVDLSVTGSQDIGNGEKKLNRSELYLGLNVDIPLQRRVATGRTQVAAANLQRLKLEQNLLDNRIAAEIKDILSALSAAQQRLVLTQSQQKATQQLEDGERTRFELGETTLLFVNLREIANGDAALLSAEATSNLLKGLADYRAALGKPAY
ncbi:MAG: TolC family protein [Methylococcales bacterium]|nr:TolC family protein [Methylococcales bacterium]